MLRRRHRGAATFRLPPARRLHARHRTPGRGRPPPRECRRGDTRPRRGAEGEVGPARPRGRDATGRRAPPRAADAVTPEPALGTPVGEPTVVSRPQPRFARPRAPRRTPAKPPTAPRLRAARRVPGSGGPGSRPTPPGDAAAGPGPTAFRRVRPATTRRPNPHSDGPLAEARTGTGAKGGCPARSLGAGYPGGRTGSGGAQRRAERGVASGVARTDLAAGSTRLRTAAERR